MEGKRYKGMFIYYDPKTQEEWTDTEFCYAHNLEHAKEILKKRNPNLIWVCSEDNKEGWHIKEDNPDWKSRSEILYGINNEQVYESMSMKKQTIKLNESQLRNIIKESIKKVLRESFQKPENWKDTPFKGTYQDENGSIYMPDDDYDVIDEDYTEYGHDLNDIMLSIENDRGMYDKIMMLVRSLSRKKTRGVILDFNTLVKSSVINQLTNDSINMVNNDRVNRGDEPYRITPSDKLQIKIFLSNKVLGLVEENK